MKRILILGFCIVMIFVIAGCSLPKSFDSKDTSTSAEETTIQSRNIEKESVTATEIKTEKKTEKQTESQKMTNEVTEKPTENVTEKATEILTEKATEKVTEMASEIDTEKVTEAVTEAVTEEEPVYEYVLNVNTGVFHLEGCRHEKKMKSKNKKYISATYSQMISWGYNPCDTCILGY